MFDRISAQHVLLLQGPVGPFFHWLACALQQRGVRVTKINFNAADSWYFSASEALAFRGTAHTWESTLQREVLARKVDAIFVFGDSRPYHLTAQRVAKRLGISLYVFEEGYLRPDYITFEPDGTNFRSQIPRTPEFFASLPKVSSKPRPPKKVGQTFWIHAWYATVYATVLTLFSWRYPHYRHHRNWNAGRQAGIWWLSAGRKLLNGLRELGLLKQLLLRPGHFFLVPLQVHDDYQIRNSRFESVPAFIREVVASFAEHAPPDAFLVIKHHPMDRGFRDYRNLLRKLSRQHGLVGRIYYVHDLHLPTLLARARGSVVVNSTVGLSSLVHSTPVKCLDDSIYAAGASPQSLKDFWRSPQAVDRMVVSQLIHWLKANVLVNGSFYRSHFWQAQQSETQEAAAPLSKPDVSSHTV